MSTRPTFEHTTCARCGGSGRFSFNAIHKDRCYGCGGTGYQLTKRGAEAARFLRDLKVKPAGEIQVGDLIRFELMSSAFFARVEEIGPDKLNPGHLCIKATRPKTGEAVRSLVFPTTPVRMGFTEQEKADHVSQALAYQNTLTKAGKPSKRTSKGAQQ